MNYIHSVARLNAIRNYKIIPKQKLNEIENSGLNALIELLKDYKYTIVTQYNEKEILKLENFDKIMTTELEETLSILSNLLNSRHRWIINWLKSFFVMEIKNNEDFENINLDIERKKQFLEYFSKIKRLNSKIVEEIFKSIVDFENIKIFLSAKMIYTMQEANKIDFLPGGTVEIQKFLISYPDETLLEKELSNTYVGINLNIFNETNFYEYLHNIIKKLTGKTLYKFFTIEPLIAYFFDKLLEVRKIKELYIKFTN